MFSSIPGAQLWSVNSSWNFKVILDIPLFKIKSIIPIIYLSIIYLQGQKLHFTLQFLNEFSSQDTDSWYNLPGGLLLIF